MQDNQRYMIDAYMKGIYDANPTGQLLEKVKDFERKLVAFAEENPSSMDPVGDSGRRDEYNSLYIEVLSGQSGSASGSGSDAAANAKTDATANTTADTATVKLPTVHEFLDSYRQVYESSVRPYGRKLTEKAYMELFDVENRTDNLMEAQLIIERENLIVNTVTADYRNIVEEFLEGVDPNYEVTSASVKSTIGVYATAQNLEEITYMGEVAQATCDDLAVQTKLKLGMFANLTALILAWEHSKRLIRQGHQEAAKLAMSMVLTRERIREYYNFMSQDMDIDMDRIFTTPFYRIMLLNPQGLDSLWRIKKVMHPSNLQAIRYILEEEVLSQLTMEEILLRPQKFPYYEMIDSNKHPEIDREYERIAQELNRDIEYFQKAENNRKVSQEELVDSTRTLGLSLYDNNGGAKRKPKVVPSAPKKAGKGILKGLFKF